ncbi:unnamed protein product [Lampetra planeri]
MESGAVEYSPPTEILPNEKRACGFRKRRVGLYGCTGVLIYRIKDSDKCLCLMFNNPAISKRELAVSVQDWMPQNTPAQLYEEMMNRNLKNEGTTFCRSLAQASDVSVKCPSVMLSVNAKMLNDSESIVWLDVMDQSAQAVQMQLQINANFGLYPNFAMAQSCPEAKEMLRALETERKVVVKVTNASRYTLCEPRVFMKRGFCQFKSDESIKPTKHALYGFRKMTADIKGCHGILGLCFQGTDEYFVLLFKNPYSYKRKLFSLSMENNSGICDIDLRKLQEMSRKVVRVDERFEFSYAGCNCLTVRSRVLQVQVKAAMSASDESVVYMTVTDEGTGEGTDKPVTKDSSTGQQISLVLQHSNSNKYPPLQRVHPSPTTTTVWLRDSVNDSVAEPADGYQRATDVTSAEVPPSHTRANSQLLAHPKLVEAVRAVMHHKNSVSVPLSMVVAPLVEVSSLEQAARSAALRRQTPHQGDVLVIPIGSVQ